MDKDKIWYGSAAASEWHDYEWLEQHLPADGSIQLKSLTNTHGLLLIAGPKARQLLQAVTRIDCTPSAFKWLDVKSGFVGIAPATIMAISYSGEEAFEIHVPNQQIYAAYQALRKAGQAFNLKLFGARAIESMRLEKGFLHWKAELITEFNPLETGLERFIDFNKNFVGKPALQEMQKKGLRKKLVTLSIACDHAPAHGGASVYAETDVIGTVTSADWGYRVQQNLALAFIDPEFSNVGQKLYVDMLGIKTAATVTQSALFDPDFSRLKRSE